MKERRFTVLLVEDDSNDALMMERAFEKLGCPADLRLVKDGEEAVEYLSAQGAYRDREAFPFPGLVLLDLKLPRKSGFEVLQWIRAQSAFCHVPVTILTSSKEAADVRHAYSLGATSYMVKPNGFNELVSMAAAITSFWITLNRYPGR